MKISKLKAGVAFATLITTGIASPTSQILAAQPDFDSNTIPTEQLIAQGSTVDLLWQQLRELQGIGRYVEALAILDQIIQLQPDSFLAWYWRGDIFSSLGDYQAAIAAYDDAIAIKPDYLLAWSSKGNSLDQLQRYQAAITSWQQALTLPTTSDYQQQLVTKSIPQQIARVLLYDLQRYTDAITVYNQLVAIDADVAANWLNRGTAFYQLSQYQDAIADFDKALQLEPQNSLAWKRRGLALYRLEQYQDAIASWENAARFDPNDLEVVELLSARQTPDDSLSPSDTSQQRLIEIRQEISVAEERLSTLRRQSQELTAQLESSQAELRQSQQQLTETRQEVQTAQAELRQSQQELTQTQQQLETAQAQLESSQAELQQSQQQLTETQQEVQTAQTEVQKSQQELTQTQQQLETTQAQLESSEVARLEVGFTTEFEKYLGISNTPLTSLEDARKMLRQMEEDNDVKSAFLYARYMPTSKEKEQEEETTTSAIKSFLGKNLEQASNSLFLNAPELNNSQQPGLSQNLQEQENDELELVLVTAEGKLIRQRLGATRAEIARVAQEFRRTVTDVKDPNGYLAPAQELYQLLIKPLEENLQTQEIQNLAFMMDKGLRSLPIAALHDGKGFLVERYGIGLMPGLSLTNLGPVDVRSSQVLGMGAEVFPDQSPLPAVPVELDVITRQLWPGEAYLNESFTVENLKQAREEELFSIVHFATHAEFREGRASNSYIQLWDKKLTLDQLRQLELNNPPVTLLVLSACRTAVGSDEAELGFAGLAVQAGVSTAMGSLWYVSDEGTLGLMTKFYEELKQIPVKAEALRQTQLAMLRGEVRIEDGQLVVENDRIPLPPELAQLSDRDFSHPYYWSAFTLIGNPW